MAVHHTFSISEQITGSQNQPFAFKQRCWLCQEIPEGKVQARFWSRGESWLARESGDGCVSLSSVVHGPRVLQKVKLLMVGRDFRQEVSFPLFLFRTHTARKSICGQLPGTGYQSPLRLPRS